MNSISVIKRCGSTMRYVIVTIICTYLAACASNVERENQPASNVKQDLQNIDVASDVHQDFSKAILLLEQGNIAQAAAVLKSVIEREKRLPAPYVNLAIAQNRLGETKAAEENLIHALKIDISHPVANNELGLLYRRAGKFKAARTAYENALDKHPDYLPAKRNLGVLCDLYIHDFNCALEQYEDYLEQQPGDKTVEIWVADVKRRLNQ